LSQTKISYGTKAYNPITGCLPDYPCWERCWARAMDKRFGDGEFKPTFHPERLEEPLHWRKPQRVLTCFCGDMLCGSFSLMEIFKVFEMMFQCPQHQFLLLTKRPQNINKLIPEYAKSFKDLNNLWLGTSVSTQAEADERIPQLLQVNCKHRWLSVEPILEDIDLTPVIKRESGMNVLTRHIEHLDWLVIGGESGHNARLAKVEWFKSISDQCKDAGVPYYFKQWGKTSIAETRHSFEQQKDKLRVRVGNDELYGDLKRREYPKELEL